MAYVKIGSSKNAAACLTYGEYKNGNRRKNIVVNALNCYPDSAKEEFQLTRNLWNKDDGIQTHTIIQSFSDDDNITMEEVNNIGLETAQKLFPAHQVVVYTHCDGKGQKKHNHIMISAVNLENGLKINNHGLLEKAREVSDEICKAHNLSIIPFDTPSKAEEALKIKGEKPWKDKLKEILNQAKNECSNLNDFMTYLKAEGITINERKSNKEYGGKSWTYIINRKDWGLKTQQMKIRGRRLGSDYTCASIMQNLAQKVKIAQNEENKPVKNNTYSDNQLDLSVLKQIVEKHIDEAAKLYFADNNKDAQDFMRLVVNIHGTNATTITDTVQIVADIKDESPKYTQNLLINTVNSNEYKVASNNDGKGLWSDIMDKLSGKEESWGDLTMYTKQTDLDDWDLKSESEKDDIRAHQAMDRY